MVNQSEEKHPFLIGGGKIAALINKIDWSNHQLGFPVNWDSTLKQTLGIILSNSFPMLICWGKNYLQFYNDAFLELTGNTAYAKNIGLRADDNIYQNIWKTISAQIDEAIKGKSISLSNAEMILYRNGYAEDCFFDFSFNAIRDDRGNIKGVLVICKETTANVKTIISQQDFLALSEELTEAIEEYATTNEELVASNEELLLLQQDLQRSEKLFKSIAINIPKSLIVVIDQNHRLITVEGDLIDELGNAGKNYAGLNPTVVEPLAKYGVIEQFYSKALAGNNFSEELILAERGNLVVHFVPLKNELDEVTSALIFAMDITDIKQAEEKSAKLAAIIESSNDAIVSKTLDSLVTSWNSAAENMFGYKAEEMIGQTIYKLIPPDRQEEEPKIISLLKTGKKVEHFETKRLTKDGQLIDVSLTISPIKDKKGNIIGISKIARDITAKKLEEQRKNDFVAMVSHELKTPLTTISSYIQILLAKAKQEGNDFRTNALTRTDVQTKKMVSMIHDFLSLARLDEGKIALHKTTFELHDLIEEVVLDAKILSGQHEIELLDCKEISINADRDKIGQVLNNLLSNAIKYSPNGGKITIGCAKENEKVKIYVKDRGVGICEEDQKRLFQRFFRSTNQKLRTISGFGIGLYLVSEVLRFHDSKMEIISKENEGSTFYFLLDYI